MFRNDVTASYTELTTIQDRTNSGLDAPDGQQSLGIAIERETVIMFGVKRPHLIPEKGSNTNELQVQLVRWGGG
jgi:hypothetical protein